MSVEQPTTPHRGETLNVRRKPRASRAGYKIVLEAPMVLVDARLHTESFRFGPVGFWESAHRDPKGKVLDFGLLEQKEAQGILDRLLKSGKWEVMS